MEPIITSKNTEKISRRDTGFYAVGFLLGIFMLVYSMAISKNALHTLYGVVITAAEVIIYLKARAKIRSYIAVYEDKVEGAALSGSNGMITVNFSFPMGSVTAVRRNEEDIIIVTDDGEYICRAGGSAGTIYGEIYDRIHHWN